MTNTIAIGLALSIASFFTLDHYVLQLDAGMFLMRRLIELIQMLAFWR